MSRLKGARLENEIDKCRAESNWKRIQELLPQITAKGSGLEHMSNFLYGEWALENFIEKSMETDGGFPKPDPGNREALKKSESYLLRVFDTADVKTAIAVESHLLLAKIHYLCANFDEATNSVNKARLDRESMQFQTLRTLRLVAEAYAVKGLSMEKKLPLMTGSKQQRLTLEEQILNCFEKSADLALAYVSELEKTHSSTSGSPGPLALPPGTRSERIGELMETAIQRVPLMYIKQGQIFGDLTNGAALKNRSLEQSVEQYRKVLTVTDKPVAQHLHQKLSRQLSELLLRGVPEGVYVSPNNSEAAGDKAKSLSFYIGKNKAYCPQSRLEEILLILSISESIAAREAVLSRAEEDEKARRLSHLNVKAVQNLLTLVLSTLRQYQLLAGILEKAMKFAFQDRFIWFQFALSLICFGKGSRAAMVLKECIGNLPEGEADPAIFMFASKLSLECLGQYDQGMDYARKAIKLSQGGWLTGRAQLLLGLGYSLKAERSTSLTERKTLHKESVGAFDDAAKHDPKDHLPVFFLALQHAIGRSTDEARRLCRKSLEIEPDQPGAYMLLALLLSGDGETHEALEVVQEAMNDFPTYYGLLVLRLKLEMILGKPEEALMTAKDLLLFWKQTCGATQYPATASGPMGGGTAGGSVFSPTPGSVQYGPAGVLAQAMRKSESMVNTAGSVAGASSSMLSFPMAHGTLATSPSALDVTDKGSVMGGTGGALSEYGGAASTISDSLGVRTGSSFQRTLQQQWRVQANIWLELAELFLEYGKLDYVQQCVEEACGLFPNSHQTLYLRGRLAEIRLVEFSGRDEVALSRGDSDIAHQAAQMKKRLVSEAKACYLGALAIFPNHIPTLRHLAVIYEMEGNAKMAEKVLRDLARMEPTDHKCWQELGQVLAEEGRHEEAASCFLTGNALEGCAPVMPFSCIPRVIDI